MRKQHYTAEIPVSNPYNIAAFEDLVSNIQAGYNEEKRLKNAAFDTGDKTKCIKEEQLQKDR